MCPKVAYQSNFEQPLFTIISDQQNLTYHLQNADTNLVDPQLVADFQSKDVIFVHAGFQSSGGHSIYINSVIDIVIQLKRSGGGRRYVSEIYFRDSEI